MRDRRLECSLLRRSCARAPFMAALFWFLVPVVAHAQRFPDPVMAALQPGRTMAARVTLKITNVGGPEDDMLLDWVRSTEGDAIRVTIEVVSPEYMAGTIHQWRLAPDRPIQRRVWSPKLGRTSRIRGDLATDPFLGSAFSYEDLGLVASAARVAGMRQSVESDAGLRTLIASPAYHFYSKVETVFDDETGLPVDALYTDRAGQPFRRITWSEPRQVDGHWIPMRIDVRDLLSGEGSQLEVEQVRFDVRLDARLFEPDFGGRPMRRGVVIGVPSPAETVPLDSPDPERKPKPVNRRSG